MFTMSIDLEYKIKKACEPFIGHMLDERMVNCIEQTVANILRDEPNVPPMHIIVETQERVGSWISGSPIYNIKLVPMLTEYKGFKNIYNEVV